MFYSIASGASVWRGYDYYKNKRVVLHKTVDENVFNGTVKGNGNMIYDVTIDINHPKKSTCNCPHAEGTRKMCKHKVALYFSLFPDEAEKYYAEVVKAQQEAEEYEAEIENMIIKCINKMTKTELQNELYYLLMEGPDYQFDRFIYEHGLDEY